MVKFVAPFAALALASSTVSALPVPTGKWPASTGTVKYDAPFVVKAGTTFDGGMKTYELSNVQCQGQTESSKDTMVFLVEPGATLKNVIIGKNQMEGVHCEKHDCTIENVWWDDVCEDALSIKGGSASSISKVLGGGARYAQDKVVQHNGPGTVTVDGFFAQDFGKLYRSCGTCGDVARKVELSNILAINPTSGIATVNKNFNDEAKFSNINIQSTKKKVVICGWSQGVAKGEGEPAKLGDGPSPPLCQYSDSDIHLNGKASSGTGSSSVGAEASADGSDVDDDVSVAPLPSVLPSSDDSSASSDTTPSPSSDDSSASADSTPAPKPTEPIKLETPTPTTASPASAPTVKPGCKRRRN